MLNGLLFTIPMLASIGVLLCLAVYSLVCEFSTKFQCKRPYPVFRNSFILSGILLIAGMSLLPEVYFVKHAIPLLFSVFVIYLVGIWAMKRSLPKNKE